VVGELTHNPALASFHPLFFALGIAVLSRVDVEAGRRVAGG